MGAAVQNDPNTTIEYAPGTTPKPAGYSSPQFTNIGSVRYNYNGGQQHQGGMLSPPSFVSTTPSTDTGWYGTDLTGAMNALNQSNGKYLLGSNTLKPGQFGYDYDDSRTGRGSPQTTYFLYDNPDYQAPSPAPPQQGITEPSYTTDAYGKPVNNGTTAGTMTSAITLDPHQQYLLNQQNAAKEQLTNALADYTGNVFNSAYRPDQDEATRLRSFKEAMGELNKTDLSGYFKVANDFVNKASGVYNAAADQYQKLIESGKMPESDWEYRKQIQDALMDYQESRLNPTYAKQADDLAVKLANQGITQGSTAYGSEWDIYNRAKNDAYQSAYNNAITLGEQAIQNQFNRDMQTYQQYANNYDLAAKYRDIAADNLNDVYSLDVQQNAALNNAAIGLMGAYQNNQQQAKSTRQQQLNELMSLMQLTAPTMPTFSHQTTSGNIAPGDYTGAATGLYGGLGGAAASGAASAQAAQQSQSNFLGDVIGAGALLGFGGAGKLFGK